MPGCKKRFLGALKMLIQYVESDLDREAIMYWTSQLMPTVVSELNYYDPAKKVKKKKILTLTARHSRALAVDLGDEGR